MEPKDIKFGGGTLVQVETFKVDIGIGGLYGSQGAPIDATTGKRVGESSR